MNRFAATRRLVHPILDFLLPSSCDVCGLPLGRHQHLGLCAGCWADLDPLTPPLCPGCSHPVPDGTDLHGPAGGMCPACSLSPPGFDGVRAAVAYQGIGRILLLGAKLGRRRERFAPMGTRLARVLELSGLDLRLTTVLPVPSHPLTLAMRGFNPAMELARQVARRLGVPLRGRVLRRRLARPERAARTGAAERRTKLRDAFICPDRSLAGERILLVDDVLTSGATAEGCLTALRRAGAERVLFSAWARTLTGSTAGGFDRTPRGTL